MKKNIQAQGNCGKSEDDFQEKKTGNEKKYLGNCRKSKDDFQEDGK